LCAFAINNDEADILSSAVSFSKFLDPLLKGPYVEAIPTE